jgi:molecular chaperone GrpE
LSVKENPSAPLPEGTGQTDQSEEETGQKAAEYLSSWQRCQADYTNLKRRSQQEVAEAGKTANAGLLLALLPVIDDMERAFAAIPPDMENKSWMKGMKLIWQKFQSTLEAQGLSSVECLGEPFDPSLHEAVRRCKGKEGVIVEEMEKGYRYRDKLIRHSKVSVGETQEDTEEE